MYLKKANHSEEAPHAIAIYQNRTVTTGANPYTIALKKAILDAASIWEIQLENLD
jgi:hypothetical protein